MNDATDYTFEQWMAVVDSVLESTVGCSSADLPDCHYRDWFDYGASPKAAAMRAIRAAKE